MGRDEHDKAYVEYLGREKGGFAGGPDYQFVSLDDALTRLVEEVNEETAEIQREYAGRRRKQQDPSDE